MVKLFSLVQHMKNVNAISVNLNLYVSPPHPSPAPVSRTHKHVLESQTVGEHQERVNVVASLSQSSSGNNSDLPSPSVE